MTARTITVGDTVRVDPAQYRAPRGARYRVHEIRDHNGTVEVTVFGGRAQREQWHTFTADVLRVCRGRS